MSGEDEKAPKNRLLNLIKDSESDSRQLSELSTKQLAKITMKYRQLQQQQNEIPPPALDGNETRDSPLSTLPRKKCKSSWVDAKFLAQFDI